MSKPTSMSPFLLLPGELRNEIYRHLLATPTIQYEHGLSSIKPRKIVLRDPEYPWLEYEKSQLLHTAILRTNKKISSEARAILLQGNSIRVSIAGTAYKDLPLAQFQNTRHLHIKGLTPCRDRRELVVTLVNLTNLRTLFMSVIFRLDDCKSTQPNICDNGISNVSPCYGTAKENLARMLKALAPLQGLKVKEEIRLEVIVSSTHEHGGIYLTSLLMASRENGQNSGNSSKT